MKLALGKERICPRIKGESTKLQSEGEARGINGASDDVLKAHESRLGSLISPSKELEENAHRV